MSTVPELYGALHDPTQNDPGSPLEQFFSLAPDTPAIERDAVAYQTAKSIFGVDSPDGSVFDPERKPLGRGQYYEQVRKVLEEGASAIDSPEAKGWQAIPRNDRAARLAAAQKAQNTWDATTQAVGNFVSDLRVSAILPAEPDAEERAAMPAEFTRDTITGTVDSAEGMEAAARARNARDQQIRDWRLAFRKTRAEDNLISEYEAHLLSQNWLAQYKAMQPDLSPKADAIVKKAAATGNGIAEEDVNTFMGLPEREFELVAHLSRSARPDASRNWWRDAGIAAKDLTVRMFGNMGRPGVQLVDNLMGADTGIAPETKREIDRRELVLREVNAHKPYGETGSEGYNAIQRALMGAATTLPFMAVAAVPVVGIPATAVDQFENVHDRILKEGGNPDDAVLGQAVSALAWGYVAKLEFAGAFGKPLTTLQRRSLFLNLAKNGVLAAGKAAGKEIAASTAGGTLGMMTMRGIEEGTVGLVMNDPATVQKTVAGFLHDADTIGTMGVLGTFGAGYKAWVGKRTALEL